MKLFNLACGITTLFLNLLVIHIEVDATAFSLPFPKRLSPSSLKQIFNVQSKDKVPEYEIIQLRILSKRSADEKDVIRVHLFAFGKEIFLRLQRNDDFNERLNSVKIYEANLTESGNVQFTEIFLEDTDIGIPYIDPVQMAAITISRGLDGKLKMEGIIGDDLFIKPAPMDIDFLGDYFTNSYKSTNENRNDFPGNSSSTGSYVHIVYKSLTKSKKFSKKFLPYDLNDIDDSVTYGNYRKRPVHPVHAWVEVLLMVDYDTYFMHSSFGYNETQIRRYYVSFFNGVDLRFKTLSDPKVSLVLSEIIIFKTKDATPFLNKHLYPEHYSFNANRAIADFSHHLYDAKVKQGLYREFDIAVLMTNLDMCTKDLIWCNRGTVGLAYYTGACLFLEDEKRFMGVAIVEDKGGFDGILTTAHEIGHLLGSDHDGVEDAFSCSDEDGYIMSHKASSDHIFQWSECSIRQFRFFLNSHKASCLFNKPSNNNELEESKLPGVMMSLDEQCERIWGTKACRWDSRVCMSLYCYSDIGPEMPCWRLLSPAAEGSPCGENLHCRHGKCVSKSLIYSPAWNMASSRDFWKSRRSQGFITTTEPPDEEGPMDFCQFYFLEIGFEEACINRRIIEECCFTQECFC